MRIGFYQRFYFEFHTDYQADHYMYIWRESERRLFLSVSGNYIRFVLLPGVTATIVEA
jgi:hypothetical protein